MLDKSVIGGEQRTLADGNAIPLLGLGVHGITTADPRLFAAAPPARS